MIATCLLGVALVVAAPTNAPLAFSTEAERTFAVPDISERSVWLDCGVDFVANASNRVEIAIGPDVDQDGQLDDDEAPFSFAVDCGMVVVRDGKGNELHSSVAGNVVRLSLVPAKNDAVDAWRLVDPNGGSLAAGEFPDGVPPLASWKLARVRMNGPVAASAQVMNWSSNLNPRVWSGGSEPQWTKARSHFPIVPPNCRIPGKSVKIVGRQRIPNPRVRAIRSA